MIKQLKRGLIAIVVGFSSFLNGCSSGLIEGEVAGREYIPYKAGTPIVSYPPAAALATILLNLATTQKEQRLIYIQGYDFKNDCELRKKENVDKRAYFQIEEGDWFVYARDRNIYNGILNSAKRFESQENR